MACAKNSFLDFLNTSALKVNSKVDVYKYSYQEHMHKHFKLFSEGKDGEIELDSLNFAKNEASSFMYRDATPSQNGIGECSNSVNDVLFNGQSGYAQATANSGIKRRAIKA